MQTEFLYVTDIPRSQKPVLLLELVNNRNARLLYFEHSVFCTSREAFIYLPNFERRQIDEAVHTLKEKRYNGEKVLKVYYIWMCSEPIRMLQAGASLLRYIFVNNIPQDLPSEEVFSGLPCSAIEHRFSQFPDREDEKWALVRYPDDALPQVVQYVIGLLRNRFLHGRYLKVAEMFVTEYNFLFKQMAPEPTYLRCGTHPSHLRFVAGVPPNFSHKFLLEALRDQNVKGGKIFFMETHNQTKSGILYVPKSLPEDRLEAMTRALHSRDLLPDSRLYLEEVWLQSMGSLPPDRAGFTRGRYIFLQNIPKNIEVPQLLYGSPISVFVSLFTINEHETQVGFAIVHNMPDHGRQMFINFLRAQQFSGQHVLVDEMWHRACREEAPVQPSVHMVNVRPDLKHEKDVSIGDLERSDFIFLTGLPGRVAKSKLIFDIGTTAHGVAILETQREGNRGGSESFVYLPNCPANVWQTAVKKLSERNFGKTRAQVYEVYMQEEDQMSASKNLFRSDYVFVYNFGNSTQKEDVLQRVPHVVQSTELTTADGDRCLFVQLTKDGYSEAASILRNKLVKGRPVFVDGVYLLKVQQENEDNMPKHGAGKRVIDFIDLSEEKRRSDVSPPDTTETDRRIGSVDLSADDAIQEECTAPKRLRS